MTGGSILELSAHCTTVIEGGTWSMVKIAPYFARAMVFEAATLATVGVRQDHFFKVQPPVC